MAHLNALTKPMLVAAPIVAVGLAAMNKRLGEDFDDYARVTMIGAAVPMSAGTVAHAYYLDGLRAVPRAVRGITGLSFGAAVGAVTALYAVEHVRDAHSKPIARRAADLLNSANAKLGVDSENRPGRWPAPTAAATRAARSDAAAAVELLQSGGIRSTPTTRFALEHVHSGVRELDTLIDKPQPRDVVVDISARAREVFVGAADALTRYSK